MNKKILTFVAALCFSMVASSHLQAGELKYYDASELTIIGKALPTDAPFTRVDRFDFKLESINRKALHSAGIGVVFKTYILVEAGDTLLLESDTYGDVNVLYKLVSEDMEADEQSVRSLVAKNIVAFLKSHDDASFE